MPFRLESCVRVRDEAPATSPPPPAHPPPPVCSRAVAGEPRSVLGVDLCVGLLGCSLAGLGRAGSLQLSPALLLREVATFRQQNKVLGSLLKLYQMFASKNQELAAVYQLLFCRQAQFSALLKG